MPKLPLIARAVLVLTLSLSVPPTAHATAATTTTLSVSPGTAVTQSTALALQASVQTGGVPITRGSVNFYDGARWIATAQLVSTGAAYPHGTANCKVRLGPGTHILTAVFGGTTAASPSTSAQTAVAVTSPAPAASTTTLATVGTPGNYSLTASVTATGAAPLTGQVSLMDQSNSGVVLATASLATPAWTTSWSAPAANTSGGATYFAVAADVNADGIPDILVSNFLANTISVLLGNGDGTFQTAADYAAGSAPFGIAICDVNGDGSPDLVVASHNSSTVLVLLGNGDGTFQPAQTFATASRNM